MADLSPETLDRLNKFKSSDKYKSLSPETQGRLESFLSKSVPQNKSSLSAEDQAISQNPLIRALIGLNKGMSDTPILNMFVAPEFKEFSDNAPQAQGMVNKVAEAAGQATPTILAASPFVRGGQALAQGAKFIPQALRGIAGASAGFGAFEGSKAALKGEKDKIVPAAIGGAASGALLGAGGQVGSNIMSKFAPALKYGANVGTAAGQAATAAAMAPEGEKGEQAIVAGGLGLISPMSPIKGKTPQEKLAKYTDTYRKVLAPSKGDINKVENLSGKNLDSYYELAAKEGLIIKSTSDGKLNTEPARIKLEEKTAPLNEEINSIISSNKAKQFKLDTVKAQAKTLLRKTFKNDLDYKRALGILDEEIAAAKAEHGDVIDGVTLNTIKQGMWAKGYDALSPNSKPTAREIGNVAKNMIEDAYPTADIKGLNKKLGDYYTLDSLLETAHGRVIQKGKLGRYVSQGIGAAAGAPIPYVGPFAGGYAAGKVHDILTSPEAITKRAAKGVSKLGMKQENVQSKQAKIETPVNNPIVSEFNPLNKSEAVKKSIGAGLGAGAMTIGSMLNPTNSEASQNIKEDAQRFQLDPLSYTQTEEGFRSKPYLDSKGVRHIGYGFNMEEPGVKSMIPQDVLNGKRELTKQEAVPIFNKLYSKAKIDAKIISGNGWSKMSDKQQQAITDMVYNIGRNKVLGFRDMLTAIKAGNWDKASKEMLDSNYARKDVPNRARRNASLIKLAKQTS